MIYAVTLFKENWEFQILKLQLVANGKETKRADINGDMQMKQIKNCKISDLIPDNKNFNKHTEYGMHLLEESIGKFGFGRSIVVDKNNRVIGGNGVLETASNLYMEDCVIVPTDGKTLVVVKREDVDIDTRFGRELCLADNATSKANLSWDEDMILDAMQELPDLNIESWGIKMDEFSVSPDDLGEDFELSNEDKSPYQKMTFTLSNKQVEAIQRALSFTLKDYPEECKCVDGNTNKVGNALAKIIQQWEEQKK